VSIAAPARSPYELVLGDGLNELHPRLQEYFRAIPAGSFGFGTGEFDRVGTPRRWLWPALWLLGRRGIVFPVWERNVPFTVVNRPRVDALGQVSVDASRQFEFGSGPRTMTDAITAGDTGLVDYLGVRRSVTATLVVEVSSGELHLRSTGIAISLGRLRLRMPVAISPRVALVERFDDAAGRQKVSLTLTAPILGLLYEYAGSFDYTIKQGEAIG
jgi:hypothetical protein